jgi:hypothetical protein
MTRTGLFGFGVGVGGQSFGSLPIELQPVIDAGSGDENGDVALIASRVDEQLSVGELQNLRHSVAQAPPIR